MVMTVRHLVKRAPPVEPLGDLLIRRAGQGLGTGVDLDTWGDSPLCQILRNRRAVGCRLSDRLVVEDHAADPLLDSVRGELQLAEPPA